MGLIDSPLPRSASPRTGTPASTAGAMELGRHIMAVALTGIGVIRAVGEGVGVPVAIVSGAAILAWHAAGAGLSDRSSGRRPVVWWLLGMATIWLAAVAVSSEFVWLAFLLWLLAGHLLPLRWGLVFSLLVLAIVILAPILHHGTTTYANVFGPLLGGIFAFGISRGYLQLLRDAAERERLLASLTRAQQEMAGLQDELALTQRESGAIAERTRLSRDIHDTVAQSLSSIRLVAHAGSERTSDHEAAQTLSQVEALAADSLVDVRRIVAALAPSELEDDALAAALRRILDRTHDETGVQVELHVDGSLPHLPTTAEVALLRAAQSALANVRRHSAATRVVASLIDAQDTVRLDIIDDGVGFDLAAWERDADQNPSSFGLRFMRERLREQGGGLDIESAPGEGTAVSMHLPILAAPPAEAGRTGDGGRP